MKFSYVVLDNDNKEKKGTLDASSMADATHALMSEGWFIKKITPKGKGKKGFTEISFGGVSLIERALFTKHLSMMMKSGISLNESLDAIHEQMPPRKFKKIIEDLLKRLRSGQSLSSSMQRHSKIFDQLYVNIVRVGEESGTLEENLEYLAGDLEDRIELRRSVRAASFYPALILSATFGLGLVLTYFVLPKITSLFTTLNFELPFTTRVLLGVADLMDKHGTVLISGIVIGVIGLRILFRQKFMKPFSHRLVLSMPILGNIVREYNLAALNRTLAILLRTGLPIDHALKITGDTTVNVVYRRILERANEQVRRGTRLSEALQRQSGSKHSPLIPLLATKMIGVGERSGNLDESFKYIAEYYEKEVNSTLENLTTILEPVLLVGIGLVVGFVAISVIAPIYQITGQFRR